MTPPSDRTRASTAPLVQPAADGGTRLPGRLGQTETLRSPDSVRALWIRAADLNEPQREIAELESILQNPATEPAVARLARQALDDLERLRTRRQHPGIAKSDAESFEQEAYRIRSLGDTLRYSNERREIATALRELSTRRGASAADAILGAGRLPEADQRRRVIRTLWYMAADAVDEGVLDAIRDHLERARYTRDSGASQLAEYALADLDRLSESMLD